MNRQFLISVLVLAVLTMALSFFIHGSLLNSEYAALANLMRTQEEAEELMVWMVLAHVFIAVGLTWIYRMGKTEGREWVGQGARFGIAIAVVAVIPTYMIYYVVQQMPESLVIQQIGYESASMVVIGMVTALLNR